MSKELEALNLLRDNHIQFTRDNHGKLDKEKLQNVINAKLAMWNILENALKRIESCAELAIEQRTTNFSKDMELLGVDISIVQQAIYRNIPMRVKIVKTRRSYDGSITHTAKLCPICNHDVSFDSQFCGHCGQKLDWEKENE